ncbi:MAG: ATP phosphoribosyltransferase [Clostridia bacterium]|nr:ATP phosphoribosyltransferase [Clostridia bacterium]
MIKIAVSKGRIERDFCKILNKVGYDIDPIINKKRKLLIKLEDNIEMIFVKADDVGTYLKYGSADIGIVGNDILIEQGLTNYFELLDLNIGKCKFCLASNSSFKKDSLDKVIATKYPKITRQFFNSKKEKVKIVKLNGSVELGPIVKISDAIVDIVETGDTLRENGLEVVEEICDISTRLVANKSSLDLKKNEIYSFVNRLEEGIKC